MFRKAIFWGLTLTLVAVIISLIVRSRREEKKQTTAAVEVIQASRPTATRILSPQDLKIVDAKMNLTRTGGNSPGQAQSQATAHHEVVVKNDGPVPFADVRLKFTYLGSEGQVLESRTYVVTKPIPPRQTESLGDIVIEGIPASTASCTAKILYADLKEHAQS